MASRSALLRLTAHGLRRHSADTNRYTRLRSVSFSGRSVSSSSRPPTTDDETIPKKQTTAAENSHGMSSQPLTHASTGVGQVIFLNSPKCGSILLASLALGDPFLAALAGYGSLTSTTLAGKILPNNEKPADETSSQVASGLLAYNGCLVGCATAVFLAPYDPSRALASTLTALSITTAGASAATVTTMSLRHTMHSPQFTYAFNLVTLTMLLRTRPFDASAAGTEASDAFATATTSATDLAMAPLKGLSQIFVVDSAVSGLGILSALTLYSPMLAGHAIMGSTLGCLTGLIVYQAPADVAMGLWGFNSALTSLGVGVFSVHSRSSMTLSAAGAIATAGTFGALQSVFGYASAPCLTLPFCFTMSACYELIASQSVRGLQLAADPHSPERNSA